MIDKKHPRKKRKIGNEKKSETLKDLSNQSLGRMDHWPVSVEGCNIGKMCLYNLSTHCKDFMYYSHTTHNSHFICINWDAD